MMVKFLVNGSPDIKRISLVHVYRLEFNTFIGSPLLSVSQWMMAAVIELGCISIWSND